MSWNTIVIFPVIYAFAVWFVAMKWRRRWPSFLGVGLGVFIPYMLADLCVAWSDHIHLAREFRLVGVLFWPYLILVGGMGLFAACLPRRPEEFQCRKCFYDIRGLDPTDLRCPECGEQWRGKGTAEHAKQNVLTPIPDGPPKTKPTL